MTLMQKFENLVNLATDVAYNYRIYENHKRLKEREDKFLTDAEQFRLDLLEHLVKEYHLDDVVEV